MTMILGTKIMSEARENKTLFASVSSFLSKKTNFGLFGEGVTLLKYQKTLKKGLFEGFYPQKGPF